MTKKEIQNIINDGWGKRRAKNKKASQKNSQLVKKWKNKDKQKISPATTTTHSTHSLTTTTLSLLVEVTYAKDY